MKVTETLNERGPAMPGGIGKKWAVDGRTIYPETLDTVRVEVDYIPERYTAATKGHVIALARRHEHGHASVAGDMLLNSNVKDAWTMLQKYAKWDNEVEAWMRGLENAVIDFDDVMFILDCLNTYRRGVPATDEQWDAARELIAVVYDGPKKDVFDYVPLEPDPDDPPPKGCMPQFGDPFGHDEGDGKGPGPGGDDEGEKQEPKGEGEENPRDNPFDWGWLKQEVLDVIAGGTSIEDAAKEFDLDPTRLPPLLQAMQ